MVGLSANPPLSKGNSQLTNEKCLKAGFNDVLQSIQPSMYPFRRVQYFNKQKLLFFQHCRGSRCIWPCQPLYKYRKSNCRYWRVLLWKSLEVFGGCSFGGMLSESLLWSCGHLMTGFKCLPLGDLLPCSLTRSIADLLLLMVMIEASVVRWPTKKSKYEYISLIYSGYFQLLYHPRLSSCCLQIQTWRAHNIPRTKHALYVIGATIWRLASP